MDRDGHSKGKSGGGGKPASSPQRGGHLSQGDRGAGSPPTVPEVSRELSHLQISQLIPTKPTSVSSKAITASGVIPPNRPSYGTIGEKVYVIVNFFKITIPDIVIHQYDVKIYDPLSERGVGEGNIVERYVCKMVMGSLVQGELKQCYPAYDGRAILYCRDRVEGPYEVEWVDSDDGDRKRKHCVVLKYAASVDLSLINALIRRDKQFHSRDEREAFLSRHQVATNTVDAIFRQFAASRFTPVGRAFYIPKPLCDLGAGFDIWEGFSQSVRPGKQQAHLNIDMSYRPFLKPIDVLNFLFDSLRLRNIDELSRLGTQQDAARKLAKLDIYPTHTKRRKYKIKDWKDVFLAPANVESFLLEGKKITVADYFKKKYNIQLEFPHLPCLNVGRGDKVNALPMEVCEIKVGQSTKQELDLKQKRNMIEATSNPPEKRFDDIRYFAKKALPIKDKLLEHYEIKTDLRMAEAIARKLPSPVVKYAGSEVRDARGKWQIQGQHFFRPIHIKVWAIVHFYGRDDGFRYKPLIGEIQKQAEEKGLHIDRPINEREIHTFSTDLRKGLDDVNELLRWTVKTFGPDLQMILCIIDRNIRSGNKRENWNSDCVYNRIKLVGDTQLPIITQCIDQNNAFSPRGSTIGGLCLKINAKQGGINHFAVVEETKHLLLGTMVMGADVNHPKPGPEMHDLPSIAAGCVALDPNISRYFSTCRFQKNLDDPRQRQEVILDFEAMSRELLQAFMKENGGKKPRRILYYRDGVSEGQFQAVIDLELTALKRACHALSPDYNPPITLVCVQKRHHMKVFVDGRDSVYNVNPGTYLDTTVTHPFEYDFYLCSHLALKGTAKAAHYHVLHDENRFTPNQLYTITYQLCYCFARCTKSVSIPPPVYYSDLIAYRYNKYFDLRLVREKDPAKIDWDHYRREVQARIEPGKMFWA